MRGADLRDADFTGADLAGANFAGARCGGTVFNNTDLSGVISLDEVVHVWPSSIDLLTLEKSQGNIPEVFLRGCGASDNTIAYSKLLFGKAINFYSCFISYSHKDKDLLVCCTIHCKGRVFAAGWMNVR